MWDPVTLYLPRDVRCEKGRLVYTTPLFPGATIVDGRLDAPHLGNTRVPSSLLASIYMCVYNLNRVGVYHNDLHTASNVLVDVPRHEFAIVDYEFVHVDAALRLPLGFAAHADSYASAFYGTPVSPREYWGQSGVWVRPAPAWWDVDGLCRALTPRQPAGYEQIWRAPAARTAEAIDVDAMPKRGRHTRKRPAPLVMPVDDDEVDGSPWSSSLRIAGRRSVRVFHSDGQLTFVRPLRRLAGAYGEYDPEAFVAAYRERLDAVRERLSTTPFYYFF